MAPHDDLPLRPADESVDGSAPNGRSGGSPLRWLVLVLAGVVLGAGLTFWWMSRARPGTATPPPTTATDAAVDSRRPKREPMTLPSLDGSDSFLRDLVSTLSQNPMLARLLATPGLARAAVLAVVQISEGRTPAVPLAALRPATRLQLTGPTTGTIAPASYGRWDGAVGALTSISPEQAAQLYVNIKPLLDQAYIELGNPTGDFDTAVAGAIRMLDDTPTSADTSAVTRRRGYVEYDDPAVRELPPVQKQFLLIGPANRRKVLTWLHQFATALDLHVE